MTCCIAAICEMDRTIVTASDQMIDFGQFSVDGITAKHEPIYPNWSMQISASDVAALWPMFNYLRLILCADVDNEKKQGKLGKSLNRIRDAVIQAYATLRSKAAEAQILSAYNLTMETFLKEGKGHFGDSVFREICKRINRVNFGEFDLLLSGFDIAGEAHLQTFSHDAITRDWDVTGFAAIGSGSSSALDILSFHSYNRMRSLKECVYRVCEAKFMAHRASGVGEETFVFISGPKEEDRKYIQRSDVRRLRRVWEEVGCPRTPPSIIDEIPRMVMTAEEIARIAKQVTQSVSRKSEQEP